MSRSFQESRGLTDLPADRAQDERISSSEARDRLQNERARYQRLLSELSSVAMREGSVDERASLLRALIELERRLQAAEYIHEQALEAAGKLLTGLEQRVIQNPELCQSLDQKQLCALFNDATPETLRRMVEAGNLEHSIQMGAFPNLVILDPDGRINLAATLHWHERGRFDQEDIILLNSPVAGVDRREPVSLWDFLRGRMGMKR